MSRSKKQQTLEEYVENMCREKRSCLNVMEKIYRDIVAGAVVLEDLNPPRDFIEYLLRSDYSLWLWTILALVLLTVISIALSPLIPFTLYLRYVMGSILTLFLPGYITIEALYPKEQELAPLERLALSIGLSLAITPLIGLALNYTPWGIRLEPVLVSLSIYITLVGIAASYRKYQKQNH